MKAMMMTDDDYFDRFGLPLSVMRIIATAGLPSGRSIYAEIIDRFILLSESEQVEALRIAREQVEDIFSRGTQPDGVKGGLGELLGRDD